MTIRVVYRPSGFVRLAILTTLGVWLVLFAYLVVYTNPPIAAVLLLSLPLIGLAWVYSLTSKGVTWEINSSVFRKRMGARLLAEVGLDEIAGLEAVASASIDEPHARLRITDRTGMERLNVVPGPALGTRDLRVIYEALAYYLQSRGVEGLNSFGWTPRLPSEMTLQAKGKRERVLPHISVSLILAGLVIIVTGSFASRVTPVQYGIGVLAFGLILFIVAALAHRRRMSGLGTRFAE